MTYNFDPDRWHDNERLRVEMKRRGGELTEDQAAAAIEEIDRRHEAMLARLDGTFELAPKSIAGANASSSGSAPSSGKHD